MPARQAVVVARWSVLGLCAALAGCASPVARRPAPASIGEQGGAWEVVLPPGGRAEPELAMDWESSRRDDALGYRDESSFSDADKPSLDDLQYLYLPHHADVLLYYSSEGSSRGAGAYGWGAYRANPVPYGRGVYRGRW